jgi:glycosyltransferase involved in cell wall biosynthesis
MAARIIGVPVIWHIRDRIAEDYLPAAGVRLVRTLARRLPAAVLVDTQTTRATLPGVDATVVPSPVAYDQITAKRSRSGPLRVGMVGRLAAWKGQHIFLEAFAHAFPAGDEEAVVVGSALFEGDEAHAAALPPLADRLDIVDRVTFTGFRDDVAAELSKLDVLVHASVVPEPFGQVVVEGMAAGLAVVATDQGGPAEVIDHGHNGLLVPPGDVAALATTLQQLAAQPVLRQQLGEAARRRASDFTPQASAAGVLKLYREVLSA